MDDSNTFQDLIDFFLRNLLSQLHIFPYSPLKEERNLFHKSTFFPPFCRI